MLGEVPHPGPNAACPQEEGPQGSGDGVHTVSTQNSCWFNHLLLVFFYHKHKAILECMSSANHSVNSDVTRLKVLSGERLYLDGLLACLDAESACVLRCWCSAR